MVCSHLIFLEHSSGRNKVKIKTRVYGALRGGGRKVGAGPAAAAAAAAGSGRRGVGGHSNSPRELRRR